MKSIKIPTSLHSMRGLLSVTYECDLELVPAWAGVVELALLEIHVIYLDLIVNVLHCLPFGHV